MTTLIKTDGQYVVKPGENLSKIASTQGITLAELMASNPQYKSNPNLIHPGDVVNFSKTTGPSYNNLTNNNPAPAQASSKLSVADLLTKILKEQQLKNSGKYNANDTALMKGSENISKANADLYSKDLANANLSNDARLSLLNGDNNVQDPGLQSIENQQKMNENHYSTTADLIKATQDAYDNEQDRLMFLLRWG